MRRHPHHPSAGIIRYAPAFCTLMLMLGGFLPVGISEYTAFYPRFVAVSVFFWAIYHPQSLPYGFLFVLGVVHDALAYLPLGLSALLLMSLKLLIARWGRIIRQQDFSAIWVMFIVSLIVMQFVFWAMLGFYYGRTMPGVFLLIQTTITAIVYPFLHRAFAGLHVMILRRRGR